jgi:hypothetical protein
MRLLHVVVFFLFVGMLGACAETRRTTGEDCLKADDCLSRVCSSQRCTAAPPLLDATTPPVPDAQADDGASDAPADGAVIRDAAADVAEGG